jgi:predicted enzyme involved in methoxymalonyl-ACP biosynthesis
VLSCRAMGRKVEETMAFLAIEAARALGVRRVTAHLLPTQRNQPCLDFWRRSGFQEMESHQFAWRTVVGYSQPACVTLVRSEGQPESVFA